MEYYQAYQNRAGQTAAVVNQYLPGLTVGAVDAAGLLARSQALAGLAQLRDDALATADTAANAENFGFLAIKKLTVTLPKSIEGELDADVPAEAALLALLAPVYAVTPRTTALALDRAMALKAALEKINPWLAAQTPARSPITSAGTSLADLDALMSAQPALAQAMDDTAADVSAARAALRTAASSVDRLNKRFYRRLEGEAREHAALAAGLGQIDTTYTNPPATLGIEKILQSEDDPPQLVVTYAASTFDESYTSVLEWQLAGAPEVFAHARPVNPAGNTLGPFAVGATVQLRTRTTNANGTTTGSVRTIKLQAAGP